MLKAMIRIQWKAAWHYVVALSFAALALPIVSVRNGWEGADKSLPRFLIELQIWGSIYPVLAGIAGLIVALLLWHSDRKGHHIYALLLPVPRRRYVLLNYTAGLVLLIPIVVSLWVGAMVATNLLTLPAGLRHVPHALAATFALAVVLLFGLSFAAAAASRRTLGVGFRLLGLLVAVHLAVVLIRPQTRILWLAVNALLTWPGPLAPLGGRWMLIDV